MGMPPLLWSICAFADARVIPGATAIGHLQCGVYLGTASALRTPGGQVPHVKKFSGPSVKGAKKPKGPTFGGPSAGGGSSAGGRFAETKKLPKGEQESKALWLPPFRPDRNVQRWLYDRTPMNIRQWAARGRRNLRHTARCEVAAAALTQALIQANTSNTPDQCGLAGSGVCCFTVQHRNVLPHTIAGWHKQWTEGLPLSVLVFFLLCQLECFQLSFLFNH